MKITHKTSKEHPMFEIGDLITDGTSSFMVVFISREKSYALLNLNTFNVTDIYNTKESLAHAILTESDVIYKNEQLELIIN